MEGSLRTDSCVLCVYRKIEAFTRVLTCALQECSHSVWTPEDTWAILETIDSAIGCFQHSEFDLVDADWSGDMNDIDGILSDCLAWTHKPVVAQGDERVIQMAKSLLPVIKMSRFLSHFQPYCKMWLPHSTGMSSQELEDLQVHFVKLEFENALIAVLIHMVPLISDADIYPGQQKCFQSWYITWCDQSSLAMENLMSTMRR
ncbi:hypothetical protein PCANC_17343 [Puccinia coronata f. sp. avenae]|uniref:Uncharacterized protein n=1 Tax=Puccinia coronata f. sp. avenae TaxID=200324 RepID=A0A2N5UUK6_9BASI|nr:hypothetical protein PCANC_17343 [Puccinia coronata f. sp. avenae]